MSKAPAVSSAPSTGSILNRHPDLGWATWFVGMAAAHAASAWNALMAGSVDESRGFVAKLMDALAEAEAAFNVESVRRGLRAVAPSVGQCRHDYWLNYARTTADFFGSVSEEMFLDSRNAADVGEKFGRMQRLPKVIAGCRDVNAIGDELVAEGERAAELREESARAMEAVGSASNRRAKQDFTEEPPEDAGFHMIPCIDTLKNLAKAVDCDEDTLKTNHKISVWLVRVNGKRWKLYSRTSGDRRHREELLSLIREENANRPAPNRANSKNRQRPTKAGKHRTPSGK